MELRKNTLFISILAIITLTALNGYSSFSNEKEEKSIIKVLSIDGGGIRGIIPGKILQRLEDLTGKPIAESFDVISGTSTGGILALGLSVPGDDGKPKYSASQISGLYERNASEIFDASYFSFG